MPQSAVKLTLILQLKHVRLYVNINTCESLCLLFKLKYMKFKKTKKQHCFLYPSLHELELHPRPVEVLVDPGVELLLQLHGEVLAPAP